MLVIVGAASQSCCQPWKQVLEHVQHQRQLSEIRRELPRCMYQPRLLLEGSAYFTWSSQLCGYYLRAATNQRNMVHVCMYVCLLYVCISFVIGLWLKFMYYITKCALCNEVYNQIGQCKKKMQELGKSMQDFSLVSDIFIVTLSSLEATSQYTM